MSFYELPEWSVKLIIIIVLFLLCMIFGVVPLKLSRDVIVEGGVSRARNLLISLSNCFAGGVFFSTVILDLFPMVKETMNDSLISVYIETDFPLGDFIIGIGFIFMLIIEQVVHSCCYNNLLTHDGHDHLKSNQDEFLSNEITRLVIPDENDPGQISEVDIISNGTKRELPHINTQQNHSGNIESNAEIDNVLEQSHNSYDTFYSEHGTHHKVNRMKKSKSLASIQSVGKVNFRAYVLVFAISLHSLFEGLAVGLMTKTQVILEVFVALVIHKSIIAFSIGVQLVDAEISSKAVLLCMGIFSSMTPIGIGLGMAVLDSFNSVIRLWLSGVLQGIATGSFLYVTFFEVLPHELSIANEKKPLKIAFVILGYAVITCVCYYENRFHKISHSQPLPPTKEPNSAKYLQ